VKIVWRELGLGIGGIGDGRGFSAYRPDFVGEIGNFTDNVPIYHFSTVIVIG
jgi:hypothetical protein